MTMAIARALMRRLVLVFVCLPLSDYLCFSQAVLPGSPSQALAESLKPYNDTRAQPDDLTTADVMALQMGVRLASRRCQELMAFPAQHSEESDEIFTLGKLCNFGEQFEVARASMVKYLSLENPPKRELALAQLVRAFVGLRDVYPAEIQVFSLLRDYPYDTVVHTAITQVLKAQEGLTLNLQDARNTTALELCDHELAATFPLMQEHRNLTDVNGDIAATDLVDDAIACVNFRRSLGLPDAAEPLDRLEKIVSASGDALATAKMALLQAESVGKSPTLPRGAATLITREGRLMPTHLPAVASKAVILAFTLWSPSAVNAMHQIATSLPAGYRLYAVTSWKSNTGDEDKPARSTSDALKDLQKSMPLQARLMIVPDTFITTLSIGHYPSGVVFADGRIQWNAPLTCDGDIRLLIRAAHGEIKQR